MNGRNILFLLTVLLTVYGCSATVKEEILFNPFESIRVAVLPFVDVDDEGKIISRDDDSEDGQDSPRSLVRRSVQRSLDNTQLDTLSPSLVKSRLHHFGFENASQNLDPAKILNTPASAYCPAIFDCDAVLYGKVTRWQRRYYGLQSVTSVGIELTLVSAKDNTVLFRSSGSDSESRGVTKIPTGVTDLVIEPLRGLDSDITVRLADKLVARMIQPLTVTSRPEYLNTSPPSIYASAHDGVRGSVRRGDHLTVLMMGTPKRRATFSIGDFVVNIPMRERSSGHYVGEYLPLPSDSFRGELVTVSLADEFGRTTKQTVMVPVSLGLVQ